MHDFWHEQLHKLIQYEGLKDRRPDPFLSLMEFWFEEMQLLISNEEGKRHKYETFGQRKRSAFFTFCQITAERSTLVCGEILAKSEEEIFVRVNRIEAYRKFTLPT